MSKKVILTEQQLQYIFKENRKHRVTHRILSNAILESYGVSDTIFDVSNDILNRCIEKLKDAPSIEVEEGITKQTISITLDDFFHFKVSAAITNLDFENDEVFNLNYEKYKNWVNYSLMSTGLFDNKYIPMWLRSYSINGVVNKELLADNIQHELEHLFQMVNAKKVLPTGTFYIKVFDILRDGNKPQEVRNIAKTLYYSFPFEQDGFVNGLYQFLFQKAPYIAMEWDDITGHTTYLAFHQLRTTYEELCQMDTNELETLLKENFNISLKKYKTIVEKAINRFAKKIGRVILRHRMNAIKHGTRVNETIDFDNPEVFFI